jgi:hypothetical protein
MRGKTYTTERGVTIQITPIPLFLDKIRKANQPPPVPTYEATLAGGGVVHYPHDETTLTTDAERAAWKEWKAAVEEHDQRLNDLIQRAVFTRAVQFAMPDDEAWIAEHESYGIVVPADPVERRRHYLETEAIGGPLDIVQVTAMANGVELGEETLRAAEDSFQRLLQRNAVESLGAEARAVDG